MLPNAPLASGPADPLSFAIAHRATWDVCLAALLELATLSQLADQQAPGGAQLAAALLQAAACGEAAGEAISYDKSSCSALDNMTGGAGFAAGPSDRARVTEAAIRLLRHHRWHAATLPALQHWTRLGTVAFTSSMQLLQACLEGARGVGASLALHVASTLHTLCDLSPSRPRTPAHVRRC